MNTVKAANTIYVLDTSAIIEDPALVLNIHGQAIIPAAVIKQLDGLKNSDPERATAARKASRFIEEAIMLTKAQICHGYDHVDLLASPADNNIVGAAILLDRKRDDRVVLITTDRDMRIAAMSCGIESRVHVYEPVNIPDDTFSEPKKTNHAATDYYDQFAEGFVKAIKFVGALIMYYILLIIITHRF